MGSVTEVNSNQSGEGRKDATRYVRVTSRARPGFVEFNFSIADPTLFLEMILPVNAYVEFCRVNQVQFLTPEQEDMVDRSEAVWHDSVAGQGPGSDNDCEHTN